MLGIYGTNNIAYQFDLVCNHFTVGCKSNDRFLLDKIFIETAHYIVGLDGVVLNKKKLLSKEETWIDFLLGENKELKAQLSMMRGSFNGFIFKKASEELILFNDHTASKNFAYYEKGGVFSFASTTWDLIALIQGELEICKDSMYSFLSYGFLFSQLAWVDGAHRMQPGSILYYQSGRVKIEQYKRFEVGQNANLSKEKTLSSLEGLFQEVVASQFAKDEEYGYHHFATLSGGLDSRVTALLGYDLGFRKQSVFTCSKIGYADETIAREIAAAYGFEHFFYGLDKVEYLFCAREMLAKNGGTVVYNGPAHVVYGMDRIWKPNFGLIHSGHLGDAVLGSYLAAKEELSPNLNYGRISADIFPVDKEWEHSRQMAYSCDEIFKLYERGFNKIASGVWGLEHLSYNISPFTHTDFLDFVLTIPYSYKYKQLVYLEWMLKYHKDWTKYKWERIHSKPNALWKLKYDIWLLRWKFGWRKLLSSDFRKGFSMTAEQYWLDNNEPLARYLETETNALLESLADFDIPYFGYIEKYAVSKNIDLKVKALSVLLILERILLGAGRSTEILK